MTNVLKESIDNIFIASANILDRMTYKLAPPSRDTVIPHNNESLMKPLTDVLKADFEAYNRVLDEYVLELQDTEYALHHLKIKIQKEAELRKKMAEEARVRKQKEEEEKQAAALKAKQDEERRRKEQEDAAAAAAAMAASQQSQQAGKLDQLGSTDDLVLDLDLDNFNFGGQDDGSGGLLDLDAGMMAASNAPSAQPQQAQQASKAVPGQQGQGQPPSQPNSATMDALNDLNLDFPGAGDFNSGGADGDLGFGSGDDGMNLLSLDGIDDPSAGNGGGNGFEDDESLMPPDQMEHLFSQFDDLVGSGI